jgi:hypothetical protein
MSSLQNFIVRKDSLLLENTKGMTIPATEIENLNAGFQVNTRSALVSRSFFRVCNHKSASTRFLYHGFASQSS